MDCMYAITAGSYYEPEPWHTCHLSRDMCLLDAGRECALFGDLENLSLEELQEEEEAYYREIERKDNEV